MTDKNSVKKEDKNFNEKSTCKNKQIIIDGVDVSGCEFSLDCISIICELKNGRTDKCNCSDYPHCYFKQLARKTQECEELKEECEDLKEDRYNLNMEMYVANRHRKALEEIEEFCATYSNNHDAYETVYKYILDIINKVKE